MWDAQFENLIRSFLPFLPADQPLTAAMSLRDNGLDSMGAVELLSAVESEYDVRFRDEALSLETFTSAGRLWTELSKLLAPAS